MQQMQHIPYLPVYRQVEGIGPYVVQVHPESAFIFNVIHDLFRYLAAAYEVINADHLRIVEG